APLYIRCRHQQLVQAHYIPYSIQQIFSDQKLPPGWSTLLPLHQNVPLLLLIYLSYYCILLSETKVRRLSDFLTNVPAPATTAQGSLLFRPLNNLHTYRGTSFYRAFSSTICRSFYF